jgi:bifunctional non-homologous end joining protein LigD
MRSALPKVTPQLCRAVHEPPTGPGWIHEVKHDGHRIIATIEYSSVRLLSRPANDATRRFTAVTKWLLQLAVTNAILDGEVAVAG